MEQHTPLYDAVVALDLAAARTAAAALADTAEGRRILFTQLRDGIDQVLRRYEAGEYFLADLLMANYLHRELVQQLLEDAPAAAAPRGTVLVGVVQGDIHDIGKTVITLMLQFSGFRVIDLGVDVPPERFVHGLLTHAPDVLLLSGTLDASRGAMAATIDAVRQAGLEDIVGLAVGGHCVDAEAAARMGAVYCGTAGEALRLCRQWAEGRPDHE